MSTEAQRPGGTTGVRLEFADDLFARRHRGLGSPIVNQWVWRLETPYDAERLQRVAAGLAAGGLSRRLHRARLPGARDLWTNADLPPALDLYDDVLPVSDLMDWLVARHGEHLDPHEGRTYKLTATDLSDGTAVVSLILAHAVGDGGSVIDAVTRAAAGEPLRLPPAPASAGARLRAEAADARAQWRAIGAWVGARRRARRDGTADVAGPPRVYPMPAPNPDPGSWTAPRLVVELDAEAVSKVAAEHGGSTNAWFVALVADLLVAVDHVPVSRGDVPVTLPVSSFEPGDTRSNSTRIALAEVPRDVLDRRDLAAVKAVCKQAYVRLAKAGPGLSPVPLPLVQMLPDAVIARLPQPQAAACMASNLGALPDAYVSAMGEQVRTVTAMAAYQDVGAEEVYAMGGGLIAWFTEAGARATLTLMAAEPDRVPSAPAWRDVVLGEIGSWGLTAELW